MSEPKSFRKPYMPPVKKMTWWMENPFFKLYMLREGTAVLALFAVLEILLGVFLFSMCNLDAAEATAETAAPYLWYVNSFLGNWFIILLNIVILGSQIFHAVTWFNLMPKAVRVFMNKNSTELLPDYVTKIGLYSALGGATVVIMIFAFATM
jgi:fumarate reductase subunit C